MKCDLTLYSTNVLCFFSCQHLATLFFVFTSTTMSRAVVLNNVIRLLENDVAVINRYFAVYGWFDMWQHPTTRNAKLKKKFEGNTHLLLVFANKMVKLTTFVMTYKCIAYLFSRSLYLDILKKFLSSPCKTQNNSFSHFLCWNPITTGCVICKSKETQTYIPTMRLTNWCKTNIIIL